MLPIAKSEAASVKDELDDLMQDFQGGKTPAWAAGAMRAANQAMMAARGLHHQWQVWLLYKQLWNQHCLSLRWMHQTNSKWLWLKQNNVQLFYRSRSLIKTSKPKLRMQHVYQRLLTSTLVQNSR